MKRFCSVQFRSFGDLVVADAVWNRVREDADRLSIAISRHLSPLAAALSPDRKWLTIPSGSASVPAVFDIRNRGGLAALQEGMDLRKAVSAADLPAHATLVLYPLGLREKLVIGRRPCVSLPHASNIYTAYRTLLGSAGFELDAPRLTRMNDERERRIGIFPGSRLASKNLPVGVVAYLLNRIESAGHIPVLHLLDGERPDLEKTFPWARIVPRDFTAMLGAVISCNSVISTDSLPAHLAEARGRPVFVVSPVPNAFWLPESSYSLRRWALFEAIERSAELNEFLDLS